MKITEGLPLGRKIASPFRTISEGDFTLLTNLTWTLDELHTNREYMKETQFGERILAGPLVLALTLGLSGTAGFRQLMKDSGLRMVAILGHDNVRYISPLQPGDSVRAEAEIMEAIPTSKPHRGVLKVRDRLFNHRGEQLLDSTRNILFERGS